jgi:SMC interacting uncharacterized protein involved in chromosome segregation
MDWITKVLEANPLSAALLCVFAALIVVLAMIKTIKGKPAEDTPQELIAALARFESRMAWAEKEIESMKAKVDPLVIAVATLGITTAALKEKVEENHEQMDKKLDRILDRLDK